MVQLRPKPRPCSIPLPQQPRSEWVPHQERGVRGFYKTPWESAPTHKPSFRAGESVPMDGIMSGMDFHSAPMPDSNHECRACGSQPPNKTVSIHNLLVSNKASLHGQCEVHSSLCVEGHAEAKGGLEVSRNALLRDSVDIEGTLNVTGACAVQEYLEVNGSCV